MSAKAVLICVFSVAAAAASQDIPAFPGAEGFGAFAKGGRGGVVLFVTNLDDYLPGKEDPVPGSLRAACTAKGPRTVLFRVAGTIPLKDSLKISEPYLTLAGQTAPGGGICLKNAELSIRTHDVIVRHLRVRVGNELAGALRASGKDYEPDAISIAAPARDVILDHCSASWCVDECVSVSGEGITNVTVQWCIIAESLDKSLHDKGSHGYGSLIRTNGNVTYHHNLYAHHKSRCPRPGTYGDGSILFDFRNNVVYDGFGYSSEDPVRMNYVANYIRRPKSKVFQVGGPATVIFDSGNVVDDALNRNLPVLVDATPQNLAAQPFDTAPVATQDAAEAYVTVLDAAGATLPSRDAVDTRIVSQVRAGTGAIIDAQSEVGGWSRLEGGTPPADADQDGMPDAWEREHGLDPASPADTNHDRNSDGYTNLEECINGIRPR